MKTPRFHEALDEALSRHKKDFGDEPERMFAVLDKCVESEEDGYLTGQTTALVVAADPTDIARMIETLMKTPDFRTAILRGVAVGVAMNPDIDEQLSAEIESVREMMKNLTKDESVL